MESKLLEDTVADVLHEPLSEADEYLYVVTPAPETVEDVVTVLGTFDAPPMVRLIAPAETLRDVLDDFMVAGAAADLVEDGALAIRSGGAPDGTVVVGAEAVVSLVRGGDHTAGLVVSDEAFVAGARDRYDDHWEDADDYQLRTPPLSAVRSSLETDISPEMAADFDAVMESLGTVRGDPDLDEVAVCLLVAAKNQELLYDLSKWGEDVGIASKATFSRTKTALEEMGLIETEKVPIDVGRPRLRLLLGDDRLDDADTSQLASVAQSTLAG